MLEIRKIKKEYRSGSNKVTALDDVSVNFRDNEFVAILGPSGSGKTTLLNIIGGLDRYDSGELRINGRSTKKYSDKDWDAYRNHSVGFVFQSYNLIPHQSVLSNVELALTLSGVSPDERRRRAIEVLEKVGLGDQLNKKPNQMSGGQMQRVAIARALVNDPEILLADEPTGALDSKTSVQIMELIQEIAKDRLVIMVTHNPKLAKAYANRIIRIRDGKIRKDTNPCHEKAPKAESDKSEKEKHTSMSLKTALGLSFNNLLTKKGRTLLTSFAGSIGIIGIALILALSSGMQAYIDGIEKDTLSSYPLTIQTESFDLSSFLSSSGSQKYKEHSNDKVYSKPTLQDSVSSFNTQMQKNDLKKFKNFLQLNEEIATLCTDIKYGYDIDMQIFKSDTSNGVYQVRPNYVFADMGVTDADIWEELIGDANLLDKQYDILAGAWPQKYDELVLFVDENNEISDLTLYALGLADISELEASSSSAQESEEEIELEGFEYSEFLNLTFKYVPSTAFYQNDGKKWVDRSDDESYMTAIVNAAPELKIVGVARPKEEAQSTVDGGTIGYLSSLTDFALFQANNSKIVKAQKENPDVDVFTGLPFKSESKASNATGTSAFVSPKPEFSAKVGGMPQAEYTANSTDATVMTEDEIYQYVDENFSGEDAERMKELIRLTLKDIRTSTDRKKLMGYLDEATQGADISSADVYSMLQLMNKDMKLQLLSAVIVAVKSGEAPDLPTADEIKNNASSNNSSSASGGTASSNKGEVKPQYSDSTLEENLALLGAADVQTPTSIQIYPINFEAKERIVEIIEEYNQQQVEQGNDENVISYTDYVNLIMSSVTSIINIVTYALVAFVAISLIVSSIMIGIITYISVLERTKEIGILRSIGASKKDISRVFNSETIIVGLTSGIIGVAVTLVLTVPINAIIKALSGISGLASLPFVGAVALVGISVVLTVIAGLIPSRVAAKKDPVEALRSE